MVTSNCLPYIPSKSSRSFLDKMSPCLCESRSGNITFSLLLRLLFQTGNRLVFFCVDRKWRVEHHVWVHKLNSERWLVRVEHHVWVFLLLLRTNSINYFYPIYQQDYMFMYLEMEFSTQIFLFSARKVTWSESSFFFSLWKQYISFCSTI